MGRNTGGTAMSLGLGFGLDLSSRNGGSSGESPPSGYVFINIQTSPGTYETLAVQTSPGVHETLAVKE